MTLEHVVKINSVICPIVNNRTIIMHGRKKFYTPKRTKIIENHILTGKFTTTTIK